MRHLFDKLEAYGRSDIYPCHMPGHKREALGKLPPALAGIDVTEIEGFDNLHHPEGILLELQQRAARLCGAEESFYLVNGSTGGILSAVSAALPRGVRILMARNCHMSAYHAAYLRGLKVTYLYPELLEEYDIYEAVTGDQIRLALEREPDIGAVLIVSPTYEGRIADVASIARIVHDRGIPLIVDEAHGAHLGLNRRVHENSCQAGADLAIQSVHKTLPALTQAALLHVNGRLIDRGVLRRFLRIYQSSSPSYLLMASIDSALDYVESCGEEAYAAFERQYREMLKNLRKCRHLRFLPEDLERQDLGKLVISVKNTAITGGQLYDTLLKSYRIQTEMAAESYVLAMFTLGDRPEGYARMEQALLEIDGKLGKDSGEDSESGGVFCIRLERFLGREEEPSSAVPLGIAWDEEKELTLLSECAGRYAGEFISLYPPGIPLAVPGERLTEEMVRDVSRWLEEGLNVQGLERRGGEDFVWTLREKSGRRHPEA
ncbi:MAG: aminotransferase class I/II-fold pyridoxal phosphate-dependent enzyme [Roseburia sp.]|nr:aminotransferase class I/II-fold pyridoxal phosphate-dependent enzyme [Roseburia sp.]